MEADNLEQIAQAFDYFWNSFEFPKADSYEIEDGLLLLKRGGQVICVANPDLLPLIKQGYLKL